MDFDDYIFPTASELLEFIKNRKTIRICGHYICYDDNWIWYTNPYGVDGILFTHIPSIEEIEVFLLDMKMDKVYGLCPE